MIRKIFASIVLSAVVLGAAPARAETASCGGRHPEVSSCEVKFAASGEREGFRLSISFGDQLFVGEFEVALTSETSRIHFHCAGATGIGFVCTGGYENLPAQGPFFPAATPLTLEAWVSGPVGVDWITSATA